MKISINNFYIYIIQGCLFLFVLVPFHYNFIKLPIFAVALAIGTVFVLKDRRLPLHRHVLLLFIFYICLGLAYLIKGHFSTDSSHSLPYVSAVYLGFPFVYFFLVLVISNRFALIRFHNTLIFAILCTSIYTIAVLISYITGGWLPILDGYRNAGFRDGGSGIAANSISPMIFMLPYLLIGMIVKGIDQNEHNLWSGNNWWYLIATALLIFVAVILAGRRVIILIVAIIPIMMLLYSSFFPRHLAHRAYKSIFMMIGLGLVTIFILAVILVVFFDFRPKYLIEEFVTGLFDSSHKSNVPRYRQAQALIEGWQNAPIFGTGHGTPADYVRGYNMPWRYELSYLSLAYHTGLVGLVCYSVGFLWMVWTSFKLLFTNPTLGMEALPLIAGFFAMIIAYSTNPYFDAFDILWTIFFPLAYLNWALRYTAR